MMMTMTISRFAIAVVAIAVVAAAVVVVVVVIAIITTVSLIFQSQLRQLRGKCCIVILQWQEDMAIRPLCVMKGVYQGCVILGVIYNMSREYFIDCVVIDVVISVCHDRACHDKLCHDRDMP